MPDVPHLSAVDLHGYRHPTVRDQLVELVGGDADVHRRLLARKTATWDRAQIGKRPGSLRVLAVVEQQPMGRSWLTGTVLGGLELDAGIAPSK
jgi:hypothetical protein